MINLKTKQLPERRTICSEVSIDHNNYTTMSEDSSQQYGDNEKNFLHNDKNCVIYLTNFKNPDNQKFREILIWCEKNIHGFYSVALNENAKYFLTIRICDETGRKKFLEKYNEYIQGVL